MLLFICFKKDQIITRVILIDIFCLIQYVLYIPAFLNYNDYNIFTVDWSELASVPWYNTAAKNTKHVSKHLAFFIDHLTSSTDARTDDFHLIGFSLGAHVVGLTNNELKSGKIKHITGNLKS